MLRDHKVPEDHVMLINLFCTPSAAKRIVRCIKVINSVFTASSVMILSIFSQLFDGHNFFIFSGYTVSEVKHFDDRGP